MKRFVKAVLSSVLITLFPGAALAAEAGETRGAEIGNAIFNLVLEVGITTFLVYMVLEWFAGVTLKKRGTIILAVAILVVYAVLLFFFPGIPIPKI